MSATSLGLDAGRGADPARFRIGGVAPHAAVRPASREELAELLRAAWRDGLSIVPWGGGVSLSREPSPARYDVAIDLGGLDRLVEYDPEDMTVTAECGVTLATLRRALAARGQELPIEGARAERATLGGALAANSSGPRRLRFGSPRDRILGARFALSDGTLARSGGRVVKNVAGYGIHRLLCGSRGGLAVIVEASLKLLPAPPRRTALVYTAEPAMVADVERWEFLPRLEPAAITVLGERMGEAIGLPPGAGRFLVVVGLEEDATWLERQAETIEKTLGDPSLRRLDDGATEALWPMLSDLEDQERPHLAFATAHNTPAALAPLLHEPGAERLIFHAPAGRLHLFPDRDAAADRVRRLSTHGFELIEARQAGPLEPVAEPQAAVASLRSRIGAALDPDRRMALSGSWLAPAGVAPHDSIGGETNG